MLRSASPMSQDLVRGHCGSIGPIRLDQLTTLQGRECDLNRALGKPGTLSHITKAGWNFSPAALLSLAVKIKINKERGRVPIMTDQVAKQHVDDVIINRNGAMKARHIRKVVVGPPTNKMSTWPFICLYH